LGKRHRGGRDARQGHDSYLDGGATSSRERQEFFGFSVPLKGRVLEPSPQPALFLPILGRGDRLQLGEVKGIAAAPGRGQEQDLFLKRRGQIQQIQDLGNAGVADLPQAGQGGAIGDGAGAQELVEAEGQGQQVGDPRHAAACGGRTRFVGAATLAVAAAAVEGHGAFDD